MLTLTLFLSSTCAKSIRLFELHSLFWSFSLLTQLFDDIVELGATFEYAADDFGGKEEWGGGSRFWFLGGKAGGG